MHLPAFIKDCHLLLHLPPFLVAQLVIQQHVIDAELDKGYFVLVILAFQPTNPNILGPIRNCRNCAVAANGTNQSGSKMMIILNTVPG